jgi:hypothetical protein
LRFSKACAYGGISLASEPPAGRPRAPIFSPEGSEIFQGGLDGDPIQSTSAIVHEDGAFSGTFGKALPDGTYTARARQFSGEERTGYVCKSRRDFTKHVRRPDGTHLKVVATVEGGALTSILRGRDILVLVDLRGLLKDTYNLHVVITRTRRDGRRVTTDSVTQVRYRTCVPRGRG